MWSAIDVIRFRDVRKAGNRAVLGNRRNVSTLISIFLSSRIAIEEALPLKFFILMERR